MARATRIETADERVVPYPVEAVFATLADVRAWPRWWPAHLRVKVYPTENGAAGSLVALDPSGGRPFGVRLVEVIPPSRIRVAYEASWLEGDGSWLLRKRETGTVARYEAEVRSNGWLAALAGRALDLPAIHSQQARDVLGALEREVGRRTASRPRQKAAR
ncbi:MAG TPA: SRPBCC family protein [Gemmatimonadales bacterium]|nr:SRPBCC family protein [Gemmatimonadales bacterium]